LTAEERAFLFSGPKEPQLFPEKPKYGSIGPRESFPEGERARSAVQQLRSEQIGTFLHGKTSRYVEVAGVLHDVKPNGQIVPSKLVQGKPRKKKKSKGPYVPHPDTVSVRVKVYSRDGGKCLRCGHSEPHVNLTLHHVVHRSQGGDNSVKNLQTLCRGCHNFVHDKMNLASGTPYSKEMEVRPFPEPATKKKTNAQALKDKKDAERLERLHALSHAALADAIKQANYTVGSLRGVTQAYVNGAVREVYTDNGELVPTARELNGRPYYTPGLITSAKPTWKDERPARPAVMHFHTVHAVTAPRTQEEEDREWARIRKERQRTHGKKPGNYRYGKDLATNFAAPMIAKLRAEAARELHL